MEEGIVKEEVLLDKLRLEYANLKNQIEEKKEELKNIRIKELKYTLAIYEMEEKTIRKIIEMKNAELKHLKKI